MKARIVDYFAERQKGFWLISPMENFFSSQFRVGILGGGQLGKMLIQSASQMDIGIRVMDPDPDAPCKTAANEFIIGSLRDYKAVYDFGLGCEVLTIEIEHVNVQALKDLEAAGKKVFPPAGTIENIQDKIRQKKLYLEHNIPTAPAIFCTNLADLRPEGMKFPCVYKSAKEGYDGKGVKILKTPGDLEGIADAPFLIEEFAGEMKEISVIVVRNEKGEMKVFPAVEMEFHPEANLVEFLNCPASLDVSAGKKANEIAMKAAEALGSVGVLAVEMFVLASGVIWVNECAPRPHNSGHHTIESCFTSQYEQHLRAILGLPLGDTRMHCPSVMVNILGEEGADGPVKYWGMEKVLALSGVKVHIYGKKKVKPFRKMGHVTILAPTSEEARNTAIFVKNNLKAGV